MYFVIVLFGLFSNTAYGQITVTQFNAGWNSANDVPWIMGLKECKSIGYSDIAKNSEEATKYKIISDEIKKIEAGLYYLRLKDIDHEIKLENEINNEAENEVSNFKTEINRFEDLIKDENDKVTPLREKNIENLSKLNNIKFTN